MGGQDHYDEAAIKRAFAQEKFTLQFHVIKNHLTDLILRSLTGFRAGKSPNATILEVLLEVEILFRKDLYDLCARRLKKALRLAETIETFPLHLELLAWNRKLLMATRSAYLPELNKLLLLEKRIIVQLENLNHFWSQTVNGVHHAKDGREHTLEIFQINRAQSEQAKVLHHHAMFSRYYATGDYGKADAEADKLISVFENNSAAIEQEPTRYVTALMNKMVLLLSLKAWDELPALLNRIKRVMTSNVIEQGSQVTLKTWMRMYNVELEMYRDQKDTVKGQELMGIVQQFVYSNQGMIPNDYLIMFYFQFASIMFCAEEFSRSLKWINEILNTNFGTFRLDVQKYARILNMMIHFELGNITLFKYTVDGCKTFLKKKRLLFAEEQLLLQLCLSLYRAAPPDYKNVFQFTLHAWQQVEIGRRNEIEDYIDVSAWLKRHAGTAV